MSHAADGPAACVDVEHDGSACVAFEAITALDSVRTFRGILFTNMSVTSLLDGHGQYLYMEF